MKPLKTGQLVKVRLPRYLSRSHNSYFQMPLRHEKPMTKDELASCMAIHIQEEMDKAILSEMSGFVVNTTTPPPVRATSRTLKTTWSVRDVASTKTQEYEKIRPQPPQRLAIILEEAEEIDMDLYHKCWVLPHKGASWDGEFWFKREELEVIQQEEELQFAHQV